MEVFMLIEGLGNVSFINGLLRIQTLKVNSDGNVHESGTLEIPGNKVGDIINGIAAAAQGISNKMGDSEESSKDDQELSNGKKDKKEDKKDSKKKK